MKDVIHEPLESLSSITEAIRHVTILIEAKRGNHRRLRNVRRMNWHLMVSFHQVQLGEDGGAMKGGREILEIRKRITVRSGGKIEMAVVAAGPPGSIREDQGLFEWRIMPAASSLSNSAFACWRQEGSRRRALAKTGGPVVWIWCCTP